MTIPTKFLLVLALLSTVVVLPHSKALFVHQAPPAGNADMWKKDSFHPAMNNLMFGKRFFTKTQRQRRAGKTIKLGKDTPSHLIGSSYKGYVLPPSHTSIKYNVLGKLKVI